jgi:hypothetical protein
MAFTSEGGHQDFPVIHDSMVRDPACRRSTKKPQGCGLFNDPLGYVA